MQIRHDSQNSSRPAICLEVVLSVAKFPMIEIHCGRVCLFTNFKFFCKVKTCISIIKPNIWSKIKENAFLLRFNDNMESMQEHKRQNSYVPFSRPTHMCRGKLSTNSFLTRRISNDGITWIAKSFWQCFLNLIGRKVELLLS